jgi:glycerophosphoryl diester phosphodiesterase
MAAPGRRARLALAAALVSLPILSSRSDAVEIIGHRNVMKRAQQALPGVKCYWIVQLRRGGEPERWLPPLDEIISRANDAKLDGVDFGAAPAIHESFVSKVKHSGLGVYVWTVDSIEEAERLARAGVDGITTNSPGRLKEHFLNPR